MQRTSFLILFYFTLLYHCPISAQSIFPEIPEIRRNDFEKAKPEPEIGFDDPLKIPSGLNQNELMDQPITIAEITFEGNKLVSDDEIQAVLFQFYGQTILASELNTIKSAVDELYSKRGYLSSGAIFDAESEQIFNKSQANIKLLIIERILTNVDVIGDKNARTLVKNKVSKFVDQPLNEKKLFSELRFLANNPVVDSINIVFRKTGYINEASIQIEVKNGRLISLEGALNNRRSPSSGRNERGLSLRSYSLRGFGDELSIDYRNTDGSHLASISYDFPINRDDGSIGINYLYSDSNILNAPLESEINQFNISFRQPIIKISTDRKQDELAVGLSVKRIDSTEKRNGVAFPLSVGSNINGKYRSTVVSLFQDFSHRTTRNSLYTQASIDFGTPIGSTNDMFFGDGSFVKFRLNSRYLHRLTSRISSVTFFRGQVASRLLPNFEQISIGGSNSIRGFDPQVLDGDSGLELIQEIQFTLFDQRGHNLEISPFLDFGVVSNKNLIFDQDQSLGSVGIALRYRFLDRLITTVEYGQPFAGDRRFARSDLTFGIIGRIF